MQIQIDHRLVVTAVGLSVLVSSLGPIGEATTTKVVYALHPPSSGKKISSRRSAQPSARPTSILSDIDREALAYAKVVRQDLSMSRYVRWQIEQDRHRKLKAGSFGSSISFAQLIRRRDGCSTLNNRLSGVCPHSARGEQQLHRYFSHSRLLVLVAFFQLETTLLPCLIVSNTHLGKVVCLRPTHFPL